MHNLRTLLTIGVILLILLARSSTAQTPKVIKIGYITDLSGIGAFYGVRSSQGLKLALDDLRQKGIPVEVLVQDSAGKPVEAVTIAIRLLEQEKVDAMICDLTPVCTAISAKLASSRKILIYHSPALSIREHNNLAFRNFIDYQIACKRIAHYWQANGISHPGSLMPNLEFGELCLKGIQEVFPDHYVFRYNPMDDLKAAVSIFKSRNIEAVLHVGYERDFISWFQLNLAQKYLPKQGFMDIMLSDTLFAAAGPSIADATLAGYQPLESDFIGRLKSQFSLTNIANLQGSALAYNAVYNLAMSIHSCVTLTADCITDKLINQPFSRLLKFRGFAMSEAYPIALKRLNGQNVELVEARP